jgi:hypothetical protein
MEIDPVLPVAGQKFSRHFELYLQFLATLQSRYVFTPLLPSETLTMFFETLNFGGTLFEKCRSRITEHWLLLCLPSLVYNFLLKMCDSDFLY